MIDTVPRNLDSLPAMVGGTPLVRLRRFEPAPGVEIYAKLESQNPGGSVKDRAALAIIEESERSGALGRDRVLLDATSGNTGIAYAMLAAARGIRVRLCVPANVTSERKRLLERYGAEIVLTDPMEGSDGAIREACRLYEREPHRYFYADQYGNAANWRAHFDGTGLEIVEQTAGRITHFVAGLGTSGTFVGTGRRLRREVPPVRLIAVQPDSPLHGLEGLKHMASAIVPAIYDPALADENLFVATEEAYALTRRLARDEGLLVGPSSGAALAACLRVAATIDRGVIVTIFPDSGERYAGESFWDPERAGSSPRERINKSPGEESESASAAARASGGGAPRAVSDDDTSLRIPSRALEVIRAHASSTYPDECCGALIGRQQGDVTDVLPLANVSDEERRRRFLVGAPEYRAAEAHADAVGGALLGFYHSHPDHPAKPSAFDLEHAWPNLSYLIISVRDGRPERAQSWRLRADRSQFDEETLVMG